MLSVIEILSGDAGVFGSDPDHLVVLQQFLGLQRSAHAHPALAEAQVQHFVNSPVFLHYNVGTDNSYIRGSVFHICRHIRSLGEKEPEFLLLVDEDQLAGILVLEFLAVITRFFEKRHGLTCEAPFCKGYSNIIVHAFLRFRITPCPFQAAEPS